MQASPDGHQPPLLSRWQVWSIRDDVCVGRLWTNEDWVPQLCAFDCAVQTAPVLQVCRRRSIGARREHRLNPFDEPMKVRASHSGHLLTGLFWVEACWAGWPPRQLPCRGSSRAVVLASGAGSPRHHLMGGGRGGPRGRFRRCAAAAGPRTRAISAPSRAPLTRRGARFVATGTSMRVAERAGGRGPTVRVPGVAAAAAAAAAALAAARRSRESGFQGACSASVWMAPGIRRRSARGQLGEAPGRLPLGRARPGGHPRPRRRRRWPRRSVSAALIVVCDCVCVLSKKSM